MRCIPLASLLASLLALGCSSSSSEPPSSQPIPQPDPACAAASGGGSARANAPILEQTLYDSWHEAWLGSPAVADLDGDGEMEIVVARSSRLLAFHMDGTVVRSIETAGSRIWASPIVADLLPGTPGLEIAFASGDQVFAHDASGNPLPGFPATGLSELRAVAAGDIDDDGDLELVAVSTNRLEANMQRDIVWAFEMNGDPVPGFPPNTTGAAGCDDACYVTGGFDQTLALGDVDGDGVADILAPQDNAYVSLHRGTGEAFDCAPIFEGRTKFSGVRFLHDYAHAQQGWSPTPATSLQAHFTNTAPAIADLDGDGESEIVMLGSVQNENQSDRLKGVALWVVNADGTRPSDWATPLHFPDYLAGLWDYEGTNVVGATNQVSLADLDPDHEGPEIVFAGFDGRVHAATADGRALWSYGYTGSRRVLTGGVLIVDLSGNGSPEVIFASYSPDEDKSHLFILDAGGNEEHVLQLPGRGAMPVPTIANVDDDPELEIIVSMKDADESTGQVRVYEVPGSEENCMPWPTGRRDYLRSGALP